MPDKNYNWYYNATCYLGIKEQDSFLLSWIGPNYTNSYDMKDISKRIRNYYLKQRSSSANNSDAKYNIDDIRYWNYSKDWQKIENNRKIQKDFEEEKLKNSENEYVPK
ncbi:MAG: hypothetical protein MUW56_17610 [Chryseobacterium sp.]|uniref:hypothetical protein n=1 Tax=Chryseobacterium sp. TaxID=1871047 RepID=UPI0025B7C05B|nr:hypothetical protein [Chryseobacterium sp.]MCJ7935384.1 hypothetical protein [Chryseobacterium sp.]